MGNRLPFSAVHAQQLKFIRDAGYVLDGTQVFYTLAEIDSSLREVHSLWLIAHDGGRARRVAEDIIDPRIACASPDGSLLAVTGNIDGDDQIFIFSLEDETSRVVTHFPQGVSGRPSWSADGRYLAFSARSRERRDPALPYRVDRATYRFDGLGYLDDVVTDIYTVELATGIVRQVTNDRCMNTSPCWSADGGSIAYLVSFPPDRMWTFLPEIHVRALDAGRSWVAVDDDWGGAFFIQWSATGEQIVFVGRPADPGFPFTQSLGIWTVPAEGGTPECRSPNVIAGSRVQVDLPIYEELASPSIRVHGNRVYFSGQAGGDVVIYRASLTGLSEVERVVARPGSTYFIDFHATRGILYLATSFVEPPELAMGMKRITGVNDRLLELINPPDVMELEVTAPDGVTSQAWVLTPGGETGPWPTVLYIHGGPYGAFGSTYMIDHQLLVGAGFAVVFNNFRGSAGYGTEFSARIHGDWGRAGSLDHHATVDAVIRRGIANGENIGVCGYSHGAIATCWLIGTSRRFKAAVAENPITNWTSAFGNIDSEAFILGEFGAPPHELPNLYQDRSPLKYAADCTTPLLLIVGEEDMRCHPVEAEQYYRVLKARGVPVEMLRLPNSAHIGTWTGPVAARLAQNEALLEWFRRHLTAPA